MHGRKHRMGLEGVIDPEEVRNQDSRTGGHALERGKAAQTGTHGKAKIEVEFHATAATRQPVEGIFPKAATRIFIGIVIQVARFAVEPSGALPVQAQRTIEVVDGNAIAGSEVEFRRRILELARFPGGRRRRPSLEQAGQEEAVHHAVAHAGIAAETPTHLVQLAVYPVEGNAYRQPVEQATSPRNSKHVIRNGHRVVVSTARDSFAFADIGNIVGPETRQRNA